MNHKNHYEKLIDRARNRQWTKKAAPFYTELHHVVPKSIGGRWLRNNTVLLTAKEHYIAHLLLTKLYEDDPIKKKAMVAAYMYMAGIAWGKEGIQNDKRNCRIYESYRKQHAENYTGEKNHMWGEITSERQKQAVRNYRLGLKESPETREKKRIAATGRKHTIISKEKNRLWHLGRKASPETKALLTKIRTGKKQSASQKQKVAEKLAEKWIITFPDGHEEEIINLNAFCKEHKLSSGNFCNYGHTKGYRARKA